MNLQPFIDLGWYTVPLQGSLTRMENGKKTLPIFEKDWQIKYAEERNTKPANLGGALTGARSGIIAIDCDNPDTYELFKSLDPDYEAVAMSFGKYDRPTGTFIYKYDESLPDGFKLHKNEGFSLDFYSNGGFIYLPTTANKTKLAWDVVPEIKAIPPAAMMLLKELSKKAVEKDVKVAQNVITARCLQPLVSQFVTNKEFMPGLFKIITPRDFRDTEQYVRDGYLHPDNVPDGRGSEYMSKVSAILGADISIDPALYVTAMWQINSLWSQPMAEEVFDKTILCPMVEGRATINGVQIWQYNADWKKHSLVLSSKRQSSLELGYDDKRASYYVVDSANDRHMVFERDSELMAHLESAALNVPTRKEVKTSLPVINVVSKPNREFGFISGEDPTAKDLNLFKQTPELNVFNHPELYEKLYEPPLTTLKFLSTLIPEEPMRNYMLSFVKYKLKHFSYSPVILYFLGVHGSGKDTLVQLLERIIGSVARPTVKEFLEMFNTYMLDTYFVQLDEFGNQLTRADEKEEALGKLKAYSGKSQIRIRSMRANGFDYMHNVTFIMTANKNPLVLEDGDRRMAMLATPNKLAEQEWVVKAGGVSRVHEKIMSEIKDFCYYLATEVPDITGAQYVQPPESAYKRKIIADSMYAAQKLAYIIKHGMWDYLKNLAAEHNAVRVENAIAAKSINTVELEELYDAMTEYKGNAKALMRELKNMGLNLTPSTHNGERVYKIQVDIPDFTGDNDDENYSTNV